MVVVGFDVGKDTLFGARIDRSGILKERYTLANTRAAVLPVLQQLRSKYKYLTVASEATGDYHRALAQSCVELDITFRLLNPLTVKRYIRTSVRKRKTDATDAEAVAHVAHQGEGTILTSTHFATTKPLLRTSVGLIQLSQSLCLMEQRLTPLLGDQPALLQVLKSCREQLGSASVSYQTAAVAGCDPDMIALLRSIPGVGQTIAPTLLIEIGDIARFKSARQVVAYAGLDPRVLQSGSTLNRYGHLTKRGAPHLRRALFLAANVAKQHDPVCKALYDKKRAEGKRYREAVLVVARKLLRIIFAVWKSGTPYRCTA